MVSLLAMRFDRPLDDVLSTRGHVRVLRALHELPEGLTVSGRELARRAGVSHPTASRVLASLADSAFVKVRRTRAQDLYEAVPGSLDDFHSRIKQLFDAERDVFGELVTFLRETIESEAPSTRAAALYGSVVWGGMTPTSDIDLAVVCSSSRLQEAEVGLETVADEVRARYGNTLSPLLIAVEEIPVRPPARLRPLLRRIAQEGWPVLGSMEREIQL
jgi:predicted nucleotidyltransferase